MIVLRSERYRESLADIGAYIAQDDPVAAFDLCELIDTQVGKLADANFPRRLGRVRGTLELVAHENYIVIVQQAGQQVKVLDVVHAARRYP